MTGNPMGEIQWLMSNDAVEMLAASPVAITDRKLRLISCACCRHFKEFLVPGPFTDAIEHAEAFADGKTTKAALKRARQAVCAARHALSSATEEDRIEWVNLWLSEVAASVNAFGGVIDEIQRFCAEGLLHADERPPAAAMLKCIFGNPFRPSEVEPKCVTAEVVAMAQEIYDERSFDRLPQLAKKLKNAGCADNEILKHLRSKQTHVRGCWALDLILNNS